MRAVVTACLSPEDLKRLEARMKVDYKPWRKTNEVYLDAKEVLEIIGDAEVFIPEGDEVKAEVINKSNLKIIAACRNDPFKIDVAAATAKGIPVLYTPGRNADAVADLAVTFILACARKLTQVDRYVHSDKYEVVEMGDWIKTYNMFTGVELGGKKVGIVALGQIGRKVAERLLPFGVQLLIHDPYAPEDQIKKYGKKVDLEELMAESDFVTIHAPPIEATRGMITEELIGKMKPTAYLINTAKASIVDNMALQQALEGNKLAGAALDVFDMEPLDRDNEFLKLENVICLPHFGGNTQEVVPRQSKMLVDDIFAVLDKKPPKNILNPEVVGLKKAAGAPGALSYAGLRDEMVKICQIIYCEGYVSGSAGNVSVRIPDEDKILITASQKEYEDTKPEDMLVLDLEGNVLEGSRNPSVEKVMHLGIYKARPDVGAIIHSHGIYSTALSLQRQELPCMIDEFVPYVGGVVKVAEYGEAGSPELAQHAVDALENRNAVFLANHGNICVGSHLTGALKVLRMVERVARIYVLARVMGGDPKQLPEDVVESEKDVYELFKEDKKV